LPTVATRALTGIDERYINPGRSSSDGTFHVANLFTWPGPVSVVHSARSTVAWEARDRACADADDGLTSLASTSSGLDADGREPSSKRFE
jgi:hypothetical protein